MTRLLRDEEDIDVREAAERIARGEAFVLDVREPYEWEAGHIPEATHIPLGELGRRLGELPRERSMIAVCRSGSRSGHVAEALRHSGYLIANLDGGMKAWRKAGLPMEPPDGHVA